MPATYKSTAEEELADDAIPPANIASEPTEVAARSLRAMDSEAVVQMLEVAYGCRNN